MRSVLVALLFLLTVARPVLAQGDALSIAQFRHTAWRSGGATPGSINQIIQTNDGYLWFSSLDGLSRFDGVTVETFSPATDDPTVSYTVSRLLQTRAGELWAGRPRVGLSIFRDGRFIPAGMPNPARDVIDLGQDRDGVIWVVNARPSGALTRFVHGRWEELDSSWGVPDGWIFSMLTARDGVLWIATLDKVAFLRPGARRFEMTDVKVLGGPGLAEDPHGHVWISDDAGTRRLPDYPGGSTQTQDLPNYPDSTIRLRSRIAFAPDGSLWGATGSSGLFRITTPDDHGVVTRFGAKDGLTDNRITTVFVDREGTVWAGGERGLNAFTTPSVVEETAIPTDAGQYFIAEDRRGSVYVSDGFSLFLIRPHRAPVLVRRGLAGLSGLCAGDGRVWLLRGQVEEIRNGRTVRSFPMDKPRGFSVCAESVGGKLWISSNDHKLAMHDDAGWHDEHQLTSGVDEEFFIDRQGRPIISSGHAGLTRIDSDRTTSWTADQLQLGRLTFVHDGAAGLIAAGTAGLARLRDGGIDRIATRRHPWLRDVRYMLETPEGEAWLFTMSSIVRLSVSDLDRAFAHPDQPIPHRVFDELDGLASGSARYDGARAARGGDGRLWFLGKGGVMRITPGALRFNALPPPIVIRTVMAGGRQVPATGPIRLPVGKPALQVDYAALSLRAPSRVRFRYRLEGVDDNWVEAGARRTAFYNNLPPGRHRFTVVGANDDGVWNSKGASLDVIVPPTFWQTRLFLCLCLLIFMAATWCLYRLRLGAVTARLRSRMSERTAERERIARELHDTLIQGVQGLILRFQLITEDLPRDQPQRKALEHALDDADEVLGQARDRVLDLRAADRTEGLEAALSKLAQRREGDAGPSVVIAVEGEPRALDEVAADEVLRIVGEAVVNARAHAEARRIEVRVAFGRHRLTVSVVDDGRGMEPDVLRDGGRPGHFGLAGMRERARVVRGRLRIDSATGAGTRIILTIPARTAYVPRAWPSWRGVLARRFSHG